jgi:NAD-dependent dihydropyrimidine dehydrogenase PreA subunit
MAYKITDACIACGSCADQCPAEAIHEGPTHYEIDPDKCLSCGSCAEQCPMNAIVEE